MKPELVTIGVQIPAEQASDLALAAAELGRTAAAELLGRIGSEWLGGGGRRPPATVRETAAEQRRLKAAAERLAILQRWWEGRRDAAARGQDIDRATAHFARRLRSAGVKASRGILYVLYVLYVWERKWQAAGPGGG
jgi:hypothetical protein